MKKIILFIIAAFLCLSMVSCKEETGNNTGTLDNDHSTENNIENHNVPPYSLLFSSIDEMNGFLNSAKGNATQYEAFIQENNMKTSIPQSNAKSIAANIEQTDIPLIKSGLVADGFGATYYLDRNELDMIYKINGIRYRFVYKYNKTSSVVRTTPAVLEDLNLGPYVVDLYQGDECFVGEVAANSAVIQIVVYTEQMNDVALNAFDMRGLSDIVNK